MGCLLSGFASNLITTNEQTTSDFVNNCPFLVPFPAAALPQSSSYLHDDEVDDYVDVDFWWRWFRSVIRVRLPNWFREKRRSAKNHVRLVNRLRKIVKSRVAKQVSNWEKSHRAAITASRDWKTSLTIEKYLVLIIIRFHSIGGVCAITMQEVVGSWVVELRWRSSSLGIIQIVVRGTGMDGCFTTDCDWWNGGWNISARKQKRSCTWSLRQYMTLTHNSIVWAK